MKLKALIILLSICFAFAFMTSGYSYWQKSIMIKTHIDVVAPPPPPSTKINTAEESENTQHAAELQMTDENAKGTFIKPIIEDDDNIIDDSKIFADDINKEADNETQLSNMAESEPGSIKIDTETNKEVEKNTDSELNIQEKMPDNN
jgi:hypothetical protein